MAITLIKPYNIDTTQSYTMANLTVTNNSSALLFIGSGANLTNLPGGNVVGQVGNALIAGTVYTNAQPNITSVGILSSLSVTGTITSGNASLGNLATANFFSGSGANLTSITGANVTGTVANATHASTANTVVNGAQSNITSLGTLTGLDVNGNIAIAGGGNISGANVVTANFFTGNGSNLSSIAGANVTGTVANATHAATANTIVDNAQPNITSVGTLTSVSVTGDANAGNLRTSGVLTAGDATITGNLTVNGTTIYANVTTLDVKDPVISLGGTGNGSPLTSNDGKDRGTLLHYYSGSAIDAFMGWDNSNAEFAFGSNVSITNDVVTFTDFGNVRTNYIFGNGSMLTGIVAAGGTANFANFAGNVTVAAQSNITSLGTLSSLSVTANANVGNVYASNISASGNISGANLDISGLVTVTGNISGGNLFTAGLANVSNLTVVNNISANTANFSGKVLSSATITDPTQFVTKNYVDNATSSGIHIHDPVNVETTGNLNASYTQGGTTPTITAITGGVSLTSAGHGLSVNDIIVFDSTSNGLTAGYPYFVFAVSGSDFQLSLTFGGTLLLGLTNGTGLSLTSRANSGVGATLENAGTQAALVVDNITLAVGNRVMVRLQTNGAHNGVYEVTDIGSNSTNWILIRATDADKYDPKTATGLSEGDYFFTLEGDINAGDSHVLTTEGVIIIGTTSLAYTLFSTGLAYTGTSPVVVQGQVISLANLTGTGDVVVLSNSPVLLTPNIGAAIGTSLSVTGDITSANSFAGANISATGNVTGGNIITSGLITATGLVKGGNLSATGNVTGSNIIGNGSSLSSLTGGNVTGEVGFAAVANSVAGANVSGFVANATLAINVTAAAQSNITSVGALTSLSVVGNTDSGNVNTAIMSATGNVTGANVFTGGVVSATGNVTGGNIRTGGVVTATGNINGGNIITGGIISATGDITTLTNVFTPVIQQTGTFSTKIELSAAAGIISVGVDGNNTQFLPSGQVRVPSVIMGGTFDGGVLNVADTSGTSLSSLRTNSVKIQTGTVGAVANTWEFSGSTLTAPGIVSAVGNVIAGNVTTVGQVSATGNVSTANFFVGNGAFLTGIVAAGGDSNFANFAGNITNSAQPNITSVGILSSLSVTANINAGNVNTAILSATGNVTGSNVDTGGLITATGNITGGNLVTGGVVTSTGNVTGGNLHTSGVLTAGDATITGNLVVNGTTIYANVSTLNVKDPIIEQGGTGNSSPLTSNDGKDRGSLLHYYTSAPVDAFMGWDNSNAEFAFGSNVSVTNEVVTFTTLGNVRADYFLGNGSQLTGTIPTANFAAFAGNVTVAAQSNITSVGTLTGVSVSGNANIGNIGTGGLITATGNINGANVNAGIVSATGNINGANVNAGIVSATGNINGANVNTGEVSATGNVTASYIIANGSSLTSITGANVTGTVANAAFATNANYAAFAGNVTIAAQSNITSVGTLSTLTVSGVTSLGPASNVKITGGTSGQFLQTDGTGNLVFATVDAASLSNGTSNIKIYSSANVEISAAGNANVLSITGSGIHINGTIDATGNINVLNANLGNLATANFFTGVLTTAAQPNVTSVGTLTGLTVSGLTNLGPVGNLTLTGGTTGQFLSTNGSGTLTFSTPTPTTVTIDDFTGNGVETTYTLSVTPVDENYTSVYIGGVYQQKNTYSVTGNEIVFSSPVPDTAPVEVTTLSGGVGSGAGGYTYSSISASTLAVAGYKYLVSTSGGAVTVSLPSSPVMGQEVGIIDATGTASSNNITIARNGSNISGAASNFTISTNRQVVMFVYYNSTQGWVSACC